ncbi:hypothetical protein ACJJTC_010512 [Scirpophaga incertulas]
MCKETPDQLMNNDNITHDEKSNCNQERVSSPVPDDGEIITPELLAMFEDVLQEPIEQNENSRMLVSPAHSTHVDVIKDVNINTWTETYSPMQSCSPNLVSVIQKPSPITLTPMSVEPLFSFSVENYESDSNEKLAEPLISSSANNCEYGNEFTPMPSPYCSFSDCSDNVDESLVQSRSLENLTVMPESGSKEHISTDTPLRTISIEEHSELDINPLSIASSLISNECSSFESGTVPQKEKEN